MQRVETRITGLDEMLHGGLPEGSSTLVVGGCGTGKTTLCLQYLYNGVTEYEENGVFVSFNESPELLRQYMSQYDWDLYKLEKAGNLALLKLDPSDVMQVIREDYGEIRDTIKSMDAKRFVIDPLSTFNVIVKDIFDQKMTLLKFCDWLRKHECTSLMALEQERMPASCLGVGFEEYVVDGVIVLYNLQISNVRQNAIEVLKMRGSDHSRKIVPFIFDNGVKVSPEEKIFWEPER